MRRSGLARLCLRSRRSTPSSASFSSDLSATTLRTCLPPGREELPRQPTRWDDGVESRHVLDVVVDEEKLWISSIATAAGIACWTVPPAASHREEAEGGAQGLSLGGGEGFAVAVRPAHVVPEHARTRRSGPARAPVSGLCQSPTGTGGKSPADQRAFRP